MLPESDAAIRVLWDPSVHGLSAGDGGRVLLPDPDERCRHARVACIDDVLAGETRVGWLRWLVLRTPGLQGTCGRIGG